MENRQIQAEGHLIKELSSKVSRLGLPWRSNGWDSMLPVQGAQVQSLIMEVDPTKVDLAATKDSAGHNEDQRSHMLQKIPHGPPGAAK